MTVFGLVSHRFEMRNSLGIEFELLFLKLQINS